MPRLLGVDIPNDRPTVISLTYLTAWARRFRGTCAQGGIDPQVRARELARTNWRGWLPSRQRLRGGRPIAAAAEPEHCPAEGYRLLPRAAASPRAAGPRPTHPDQRPDPKGPKKTVAGKKGVKDLR